MACCSMMSLVRSMYPLFADESFLERSREVADDPDLDPTVRGTLLTGNDTLATDAPARGTAHLDLQWRVQRS